MFGLERSLSLRSVQTWERAKRTTDTEKTEGGGREGGATGRCHSMAFGNHTLSTLSVASFLHSHHTSATRGGRGELKVPRVTMEKLQTTAYF